MLKFVLVLLALVVAEGQTEDRPKTDGAQERLIALYSTFSLTSLTSTTTTVAFTCSVSTPTAACRRRRRRRRSHVQAVDLSPLATPEVATPELMPSLDRSNGDLDRNSDVPGRFHFTVWTTTRTTLTATFKSTDYSTTVSVLMFCTVTGGSNIPVCG